jgi:hypothetical protein
MKEDGGGMIQLSSAQHVHEGRGRGEGIVERGERRGIQLRYAQHMHEGGWRGGRRKDGGRDRAWGRKKLTSRSY